jgi:hypothetical protein
VQSNIASFLASAAILLALVSCGHGGSSARETSGTVKGTASSPSDTGPTGQVATVVLSDGSQVVANVLAPHMVRAGQQVRVRETVGVISGWKTYDVVGVIQP